ncbi:MAG: hypothetical protein K6B44_11370, partial [Lachnospiraceae bacterium]|nr:hypothetical protein [Lachnospiraceae bacterium]
MAGMSKFRRMLAMMMAVIMAFTLIPAEAFAQNENDEDHIQDEYDVERGTEEIQYDGPVAELLPCNPEAEAYGTYNTLQAAFDAAAEKEQYVIVKLLQDVTINTEHTLNQDINLFLNGHELIIPEGVTLTGTTGDPERYPVIDIFSDFSSGAGGSITNNGTLNAYIEVYSDDVSISVAGGSVESIMLFKGSLYVSGGAIKWVQTWGTAEISGGTIDSFGPENGLSTITGGTIRSIAVMNNDGSPTVDIRGDVTVTEELLLEYYGGDDKCGIETVTISGTPKIKAVGFNIQKFGEEEDDGTGNWGSISISGGYFGNNPKAILDGRDAVQTAHLDIDIPELEAYTGQTDWAADHEIYGWRLVDANPSADYAVKVDYRYKTSDATEVYETVKYETIEAALKATETADYKENCEGFVHYHHPLMTLLKNVTIDKAISFNLNPDPFMGQIVVEMNGHNLEILDNGGLTGTGKLMFEGTKKGKFISNGTLGLNGDDGNIFIFKGCDFTVTGGTVTSETHITTGNVNISGGEFTEKLDLVNVNPDIGLKVTISGSAKMRNISYEVNKYISSISLNLLGGYYAQAPESFKTYNSEDQSGYVNYDETKLEQYSGQTDWEAEPETYTYRIKREISPSSYSKLPEAVSGLVENGSAQALITAGTAAGGTIKYALGESATTAPTSGWSTNIPAATAAGTYYVWYRLDPDANHMAIAAACITV